MNTDMRAALTVTADASALVAEMRKGSEGLRELRREAEAAATAARFAASEQGQMAAAFNQGFDSFGANRKSARDSASVFQGADEYEAFRREQADQAARSYRAIEESLNPLIRAERELAQAQDVVNRALAEGQTSQENAARTLQQLQARYDGLVRAQSPAARSAQVFEASLEAETAAMRDLTLVLDPAARASAEFERVQGQVDRAVRMNIITQEEATRVMDLLAKRQKAVGGGFAGMGMGIQNASYQIADFAVQVQAGQAWSMALAQQLPQLVGGFGVLGAAAGAAIAIGVPLITMWMNSGDAASAFEDRLQKLEGTVSSVSDRLKLLGDQRLDETFGNLTDEVRSMTQALLTLERAAELKQLRSTLDGLFKENVDLNWLERGFTGLGHVDRKYEELTGGVGPSLPEFRELRAGIDARAKSGDVEGTVAAVADLVQRFADGGPVTDLNDELLEMLDTLGEFAKGIAEFEAAFNGTSKNNAITRQIDEMVRASKQQAEVSRAIRQFGEGSVEVEAMRAEHARTALELQLREMDVTEDSTQARRAMAALEEEINASTALRAQERQREVDALFDEMQREAALSAAILQFGKDSAEVEAMRAEHARQVNDERLKEMGLSGALLSLAQDMFAAEQKRARAGRDAEAGRRADRMLSDLREQADMNRAIAVHGRDSLQVKELQIAAERRAYAESVKALNIGEERKRQLMDEWEAARGLASADPFGQVAAAREMLQSQAERIQNLKLEQALLGQSEATRSRILALWKAEQEIRRQGIDATSERARMIREAAEEEDALTRSIQRQADAWKSVQSAAESAMDGIFDKLMDGDWEGALEDLAKNVTSTIFDLAIRNPAKNAALGKDLPTMADAGGLGGIWDMLTGRRDGADITLPDAVTDFDTMDVQAATVILGGPGVMSLLGNMPGAANMPIGPGGGVVDGQISQLGGGDVPAQMWNFFSQKGLKPHQIAGILGNAYAESRFDPTALQPDGNGTGLFQHDDRRFKLLDYIGGRQNLGDVNKQLEFVWHEFMTTEGRAFQNLMNSKDVRGATEAMLGFERPAGFTWADPTGSHQYDTRVQAAQVAMEQFGRAAQTATTDLGTLGSGMDGLGSALANAIGGSVGGDKGGLLGILIQLGGNALGIPGFAAGGDHFGGLRIVGENGPELEFTGPSRIMNAQITRQLLSAQNAPSPANTASQVVDARPVIQVVNNSRAAISAEVEETTDSRGQRQYRLVMDDAVASAMGVSGGKTQRALRDRFGVSPGGVRR